MDFTDSERAFVQSMRKSTAYKDYTVPFIAVVVLCITAVVGVDAYIAFQNGGFSNLAPLLNEVFLYVAIFAAGYVSCIMKQNKKFIALLEILSKISSKD
jgi:hypothetical protein